MADEAKPGRAKPVPERFAVFEADPTAHLTEGQKGWKASKLCAPSERFAALVPQPALVVKVHLVGSLPEADQVVLAADIYGLVQALSEAERDLGGGGLTLTDQRTESAAVLLTLRPSVAEGADRRTATLIELLANANPRTATEPTANVLKLLDAAVRSPSSRMNLVLAASRTVARCEVLTPAA